MQHKQNYKYKEPPTTTQQRRMKQQSFWKTMKAACDNGGGFVEKDGIAVIDMNRYEVKLK